MAVNFASKFSSKLDEAFKLSSYTDAYVNKDYDFDGVNTVNVYSLDTVPLVDYTIPASSASPALVDRYGGGNEIQDTVQTFVVANDKAFKGYLDKKNRDDSSGAKTAAKWMALEVNQQFVPAVDQNVFDVAYNAAIGTGGGGTKAYTAATVLHDMRVMRANARNVSAPNAGMVFFVSTLAEVDIKDQLTPYMAQGTPTIVTGNTIGTIDGVPVVSVPADLLPAGVMVLFWHKSAILTARKLTETRIKSDSEFVSGDVILGRFRYDTFAIKGHANRNGIDTKLATIQVLEV